MTNNINEEVIKHINKSFAIVLIVFLCIPLCLKADNSEKKTKEFAFKEKKSLKEWQEKIFKGKVLYSVTEEKEGYLIATSKETASGIFYRINFNPKKEPMVSWKWKVIKFPEKIEGASVAGSWIEKDDYAARFYIIFPGMSFASTKSLEYVWDKTLAEGTIMTSPYFKNIKIIVVESGTQNMDNWVYEERNIINDFKEAFGKEYSCPSVGAIAIMTDSDNSISTAEAHYDEMKVGYKNEPESK